MRRTEETPGHNVCFLILFSGKRVIFSHKFVTDTQYGASIKLFLIFGHELVSLLR